MFRAFVTHDVTISLTIFYRSSNSMEISLCCQLIISNELIAAEFAYTTRQFYSRDMCQKKELQLISFSSICNNDGNVVSGTDPCVLVLNGFVAMCKQLEFVKYTTLCV